MDHLMTAEGEGGLRNPMIEVRSGYLEMNGGYEFPKSEREAVFLITVVQDHLRLDV